MVMFYVIFFFFFVLSFIFLVAGGVFMGENLSVLLEWVICRFIGMDMSVIFLLDWMSLVFSGVVFLISSCVFMYSNAYMKGDLSMFSFGFMVFLFVISMIFLVLSPSFVSILVGWDGLGLSSYFLVIYYGSWSSYNAGMITGVTNRLGDVGLLMVVGMMFNSGVWNYYFFGGFSVVEIGFLGFMVLLAGFTKSAQIPFSAWLPAAMAAPTPVSALVHSSTLVTAGIYLMIRFYWFFSQMSFFCFFVVFLGMLTMVMAGFVAIFEMDMKSIIALSTLSQLGFMVFSVGLGNLVMAFFHLVIHALFSALLFLCGGKMIYVFGGGQDIRYMGGVSISLPVSVVMLNVSSLSLCGFPFMSGYYSKDVILEFGSYGNLNYFLVLILVFGVALTCLYTLSFVWLSGVLVYGGCVFKWCDEDFNFIFPMLVLGFCGVFGGAYFFWFGVLEIGEVIVWGLTSIGLFLFVSVFLLVSFYVFFSEFLYMMYRGIGVSSFFYYMWFIPGIGVSFLGGVLKFGWDVMEEYDVGWGEWLGASVMGKWSSVMGFFVQMIGSIEYMSLFFFCSFWFIMWVFFMY